MTKSALWGVLCTALLFAADARASESSCAGWPDWRLFRQLYVSEDGRVIDASVAPGITVSEGQAYALLFSLIGNDAAQFEKILRWTRDNLARGDLEHVLPAWKWGQGGDGRWGVLDPNSASDADLWTVYALFEAARLWHKPDYADLARVMSELILRDEVGFAPDLGTILLPGPNGFVAQQTWRLNASYAPLQVLRLIAGDSSNGLWSDLLDSSARVILESAPRGYASDWITYRPGEGFKPDPASHESGSYDAIRVYLWAGMLADGEPRAGALLKKLRPMVDAAASRPPPETIDTVTLENRGEAPPGFSAALLPLLVQCKLQAAVDAYRKRLQSVALKDNRHYYSDALTLFGRGWLDHRFRFDSQGRLRVDWSKSCAES